MLKTVGDVLLAGALTGALALGPVTGATSATGTDLTPRAVTANGITGTWKGAVISQDGPAGYSGRVHIRRTADGYAATARYDDLGSATWTYRGRAHGWFSFREHFHSARTARSQQRAGGTVVKVRRVGSRLQVHWRDPQADYTGHMSARRV